MPQEREPLGFVSTVLQYAACRSGNVGKWRTLHVSERVPVRTAVAATARSMLSMVC